MSGTLCGECGALVGEPIRHGEWHQRMAKAEARANLLWPLPDDPREAVAEVSAWAESARG